MAKRRKKTVSEKYVELLETHAELLEKMVASQEKHIQELEQQGVTTTNIPYSSPWITIPAPQSPSHCQHQFPQYWQGTGPVPCSICGQLIYPGGQSGTIITTNVPPYGGTFTTQIAQGQAPNGHGMAIGGTLPPSTVTINNAGNLSQDMASV